MPTRAYKNRSAFSLVELVVVIVIIGILAAMAIPRLSRGSAGAGDSALSGNLAILRNAINMYAAEHNNKFPGDTGDFVEQLTWYSDVAGNTQQSAGAAFPYGPYIVAVPPCPVGNTSKPTEVLIDNTKPVPDVNTAGGEGWVYNAKTGNLRANTNDMDSASRNYADY